MSTMKKLKQLARWWIPRLVSCLILSGLLVVCVLSACPLDSQTTVEEPDTSEAPITSQSPTTPSEPSTTLEEPTESTPPVQPAPEEVLYTEDELFCMAAVIYNEAGADTCTNEWRELVGYVVLNRVNDSRYPNSIREVLEQRGQYAGMGAGVKFTARHTKPEEAHAVERAYETARRVLENRNSIPIPSNVVFQAEFKQGIGVYKHIGNTYFCYAQEVN